MKSIHSLITVLLLGTFLLPFWSRPVLSQENGIFAGRVVDVSQQPVAGAGIFVYNTSNVRRAADYIASSSGNGEFRLTLPAGHYWAVARVRHGGEQYGPLLPGDRHSGGAMEIDITAAQTLEEEFVVADLKETSQLEVKLDTSFLQVGGKLLTKEGAPLAAAYAFARLKETARGIPEYVSAWTDESGQYTLFLPPGTYWLGLAQKFPPGPESVPWQKVTVDNPRKDINIVSR